MRIDLSQAAERDIESILEYSLKTFGAMQAETYYRSLRKCFELIAENPEIGLRRSDLTPPLRSHPHQSHVIFYEIHDDFILIVRILHGRMDPRRHL
jgi:toxin ParE1/3/4